MSKWEIATLSDIGEIITGNTPKTSEPENYESNDIPFLKPSDFNNDSLDLKETEFYISEKARNKARILPIDSVVVTCIGIIGKTKILTKECAFNQQINAIILKNNCYNRFVAYAITFQKDLLQGKANAAVVPIINKSEFSNIKIPLPPLETQRKIAATLDKVTRTIDLCNAILEKLDLLVKARFVEMFGDPIDNPMGWQIKPLKELSTLITNGNTPKGGSENYVDTGIIFLRSQNVWRNKIDLSDVAFIDEATNQKMKKSIVKHKDILITKTGRINTENSSLGRAALYLGEDNSANINGHVYLVRLNSSVVPEYVVTILTGEAYRKYIRKVCVGGIDKRQINLDQVEDFPIILPPKEQQQQFADFSNQIDKSKLAVKKVLEKAETLKKALMQEYFG